MKNHLQGEFESFTLEDRAGNTHHYDCHYHNPDEAMSLCLRIAKAGGQALARLVEDNLPMLIRSFIESGIEDFDQEKFIKRLVASAITGDGEVEFNAHQMVTDLADVLIETNEKGLLIEIFSKTFRDNVELSDRDAYNAAYRANYGEYRQALVKIFLINGFHDFLVGGLNIETPKTDQATDTQPTSPELPSPEASPTA